MGFVDGSTPQSACGALFLRAVVLIGALLALGPAEGAHVGQQGEPELLEPEQVFRLEARMDSPDTLRVTWRIAPDHYMYRQRFTVNAVDGGVILGQPVFPKGKVQTDEYFGEMEIYQSDVSFSIPVTRVSDGLDEFVIKATGQGCNEALGVCFPPVTHSVAVQMAAASTTQQSLMNDAPDSAGPLDSLKALMSGPTVQPEFLQPDEAFSFQLTPMDHETLLARFRIEPGYYLYKDKFAVSSDDPGIEVTGLDLPKGVTKIDEYFGEIVAFYEGFDAQVALRRDSSRAQSASFKLSYQGCAEGGICYPPIEKTVTLRLPGVADAVAAGGDFGPSFAGGTGLLATGIWPLLVAFGSGLLLTFTPCVLPMVPILAGIIVGQGCGVTRVRGGGLATVYVLGTAVTYTAVGVVAGLTGDQLQAYFQNAWGIGFVSALLVLMALSMFGLFELKMPSAIQSRLQHQASGVKAGAFGGVFVMGILSALIVGACVSPVLISILSLAINGGDPVLGGAIMFAMAMGMGLFLIALGFGFGHVLPRTGPWMEIVNHFFGFLLLAVVIYLLGAFPQVPVMYLWAALLIAAAIYLGRASSPKENQGWSRARQGIAVLLLVWGVLAMLGGFQGNRDVLKPVDAAALLGNPPQTLEHARFQQVGEPAGLEQLMRTAVDLGKPVLIDYYADWCVDCVRMEKSTLASQEVSRTLNEEFILVQVDVTDPNDPGTRAIKQSHEIFGPPAMLFFDRQGNEVKSMRRYGYMDSDTFLAHIRPLLDQ